MEVLYCAASISELMMQEAHPRVQRYVILQEISVTSCCEASLNEMWYNEVAAQYPTPHIYRKTALKITFCHLM
jgi:hypothetical protein